MKFTQQERDEAEEAARKCINAAIDLQDLGFGCSTTETIITLSRRLESDVQDKESGIFKD